MSTEFGRYVTSEQYLGRGNFCSGRLGLTEFVTLDRSEHGRVTGNIYIYIFISLSMLPPPLLKPRFDLKAWRAQ